MRFFRFLFKICFWFVVFTLALVLLYKFVPVPFTPLMVIRYFENDSSKVLKHDWVPIDDISTNLQRAVICSEDQNFLKHSGLDYKAIEKAISSSQKGKRLRGGSTISQQTAKNVFLWPERSWVRKGFETYFTFLIELCWSKQRILEVYLNSIEMGKGIYGAEAASKYWFKKPAKNLSQYEAAAIAAILPNPRKYRASPATAYMESRKAWIVKQMRYFGPLKFKEKDHGKR
ncbi:monofunctional biosynthetic peptidoglycan transglycosylase [Pseudotamlana carrageenivorans]|uniref:Biosynthetic peptidoglycan transglycosylase n=1 Tax=Pseudotamlana carrageenivorans TaxID=2069432 RepID=A0A2I7SGS9_9FLAO|nr:monofunctional biosynthetic peptidoglycan transglycosylase [Tamlana carrageenivorans]AUS05103.1 monofunctional biosynthetic peptidoglycan transglycosylase [Tamlana carrageenivorans]